MFDPGIKMDIDCSKGSHGKPATVLDTFGFTVAPVLIRDTTRAYRPSLVIEAKDVDEGS